MVNRWESWTDTPGGFYQSDWLRVLRAQEYRCGLCGRHEDEVELKKSRRIPASRGGTNYVGNLVALCQRCINRKQGKTMMEVRLIDVRAERLMARRDAGEFGTVMDHSMKDVKTRTYRKALALAAHYGYFRPDGSTLRKGDPDACTCQRKQPHLRDSLACLSRRRQGRTRDWSTWSPPEYLTPPGVNLDD